MKKLFYLYASALLFTFATGCSSKKDKMIAINNKITETNDSLFMKGEAWGEEIGAAWSGKDFTRVATLHADVLGYIDRKEEEIKDMNNAGGSEKLKDAELSFLEYEKSILTPAAVFNGFNASTSQETFMAAYQQMQTSAQNENQKLLEIQQLQKEYAQKNQLPLTPTEE